MPAVAQTQLGGALLTHLDEQLQSTRRLLDHVLRQGQATRRRSVDEVLTAMAAIQGEMERRGRLEGDRTALLGHAAARLGIPAHAVTLDALSTLLAPAEAAQAQHRSAELRGLLSEIGREHAINRALMKQELAFLDHLTRMLGSEEPMGYRPPGEARSPFSAAPMQPRPSGRAGLLSLDLEA